MGARVIGAAGLAATLLVGACVPTGAAENRDAGAPAASTSASAPKPHARRDSKVRPDSPRRRSSDAARKPNRQKPARAAASSPPVASALANASRVGDSSGNANDPITETYSDDFERTELGPDWNPTSPHWRVRGGRLCATGARNHPAWLRRPLPVNARIEFDASSSSSDGDIKVEVWGDGRSAARSASYSDASSYVAIFGGWKNQFHVLARQDEHAPDRPQIKISQDGDWRARPVVPSRSYHFKLERNDGKTLVWLVDDIELFTFADPQPLVGDGHEHLGFNDWDTPVCFDNLVITPLGEE